MVELTLRGATRLEVSTAGKYSPRFRSDTLGISRTDPDGNTNQFNNHPLAIATLSHSWSHARWYRYFLTFVAVQYLLS